MPDKIIKQIHQQLLHNHKTIAVAESCTGGLLANLLTQESGSSNYFLLGVVTYSNKSKEKILNIPTQTIAKYGAVSAQVAKLMAANIRKKIKSDFGIGITGIAGPSGATCTKPIGTVFIALADKNKTLCRLYSFSGQRADIRQKSAKAALHLLNLNLKTSKP